MASGGLAGVTRLILEEKGYSCRKEIQVFEWIEGELNTVEERSKSCLLCAQAQQVLQLKWDLRVVYKVIDSMRALQNEELAREHEERVPDQQRLNALAEGLKAIGNNIERVRACECVCEIAMAINLLGLPSMEEVTSLIKETLGARLSGDLVGPTMLAEMLRNHPKHSKLSSTELLNSQNLFDLSDINSSKCNVDEVLQVVRCIVLYMVLETVAKQPNSANSVELYLDVARRFGKGISLNTEYKDAALALWLLDSKVDLDRAVYLLARISLAQLFPSSNLNDFLVLNALCSVDEHVKYSLRLARMKGTKLIPQNLDEALVIIKAMLLSNCWREALGLQRRFATYLPEGSAINLILGCIFDWVIQQSCSSNNHKLARLLLQYPFSLREQGCLQEYLWKLSRNDSGPAGGLATDLLFAFNLVQYRTGVASVLHEKLSKDLVDRDLLNASRSDKHCDRERLLKHHRNSLPINLSEEAFHLLPLVGTIVRRLPRSRMETYQKLNYKKLEEPYATIETDSEQLDGITSTPDSPVQPIASNKMLVIRREDEYQSPFFAPPSKRGRLGIQNRAVENGWQ